MFNKRIYLYKLKNHRLLARLTFFSIFKYTIGLNTITEGKIKDIIHLLKAQKGDIGIINYWSIFMLYMKVDLINRYKILDESLVEDTKTSRNTFKISYCLRSLINQGQRIVIAIFKDEKGKVSTLNTVPSLTEIYNSANWLERENFDLFGVIYKNHPDLRRILTDYGFVGAPFRKDFPLIGYKELSYNSENGSVTYKKISLLQEYRNFEMINPWIK